jgi:hypothetical protein
MTVSSLVDSPLRDKYVSDPNEPHKIKLLDQFYLTLRVTYMAAPQVAGSVVHERIERLFNEVRSWPNAYEIEQLLCFVLSPDQLETELNRRLAEATALKLEFAPVIDKELHREPSNPPADKRIVLHRLLNDLQWFYSKRNQHRAATRRLMVRVSLLFMVALATFALVLFIQFFAHGPATASAAAPTAATQNAGGAQNAGAGAGAGPVANQPPQGQATTTGGAASGTTTNPAPANQATPNQGAPGQPTTTGGAK